MHETSMQKLHSTISWIHRSPPHTIPIHLGWLLQARRKISHLLQLQIIPQRRIRSFICNLLFQSRQNQISVLQICDAAIWIRWCWLVYAVFADVDLRVACSAFVGGPARCRGGYEFVGVEGYDGGAGDEEAGAGYGGAGFEELPIE